MNIVRDEQAGMRWLNLIWTEAQRQNASAQPSLKENKKREVPAPRYAPNAA